MKNHNVTSSSILIFAEEGVWWESCKNISINLKKAYEKANLHLNWQSISIAEADRDFKNQTGYVKSWCQNLLKLKPSRFIFVDFHPQQAKLAQCLAELNQEKEKIEFVFHIYGDFTLLSDHWAKAHHALKGHPVRFLCASDRQVEFLKNLLLESEGTVQLCPFPVDTNHFQFDVGLRKRARQKLKISPEDRLIVYTGRISTQKNVASLVQVFPDLVKKNPKIKKLLIAGDFDDIGGRLLGLPILLGWSFANMQNELNKIPQSLRKRIEWLGHLNRQEMKELLHATDLFCSLSLYHDEDFGMSPAEALACGAPCVLSDWGGYASFAKQNLSCRLSPVHLTNQGFQLDLSAFQSLALEALKEPISINERSRQSQAFQKYFSIESISCLLEKLHSAPALDFQGFHSRLEILTKQVFRNLHPKAGSFYEEIYHPYFNRSER